VIWQSEREKGQSFPVERLKVNRKCLSFVNDEKSFYLWNNKAYFVFDFNMITMGHYYYWLFFVLFGL